MSYNNGELIENNDLVNAFQQFIQQLHALCDIKPEENNYDSDNKVYQSSEGGDYPKTPDSGYTAITGNNIPYIYPTDDFGNLSNVMPNVNKNTIIDSQIITNILINTANTYLNIRKIYSNWYHTIGSTSILQYSKEGYAIMQNETIPSRDKTDYTINDINVSIENTLGLKPLSITNYNILSSINPTTLIETSDLVKAINDLYDRWRQQIDSSNYTITYNIYTCHWVCHSNWGSTRSRR